MRGKARLLCALLLVLLCVAARLQGAWCREGDGGVGGHGGGGGHGEGGSDGEGGGDGGGGRRGGRRGGGEEEGGGRGGRGFGRGGGDSDGEGGGRDGGGFGRGGGGGWFIPWSQGRTAEPRGRGAWRVSGAATTFAAAALVWWL